jgi:hypothetical protein
MNEHSFKTPPKKKENSENSSISSISEQEEENDNEFDSLWSDVKIKSDISESKSKFTFE